MSDDEENDKLQKKVKLNTNTFSLEKTDHNLSQI